MAKIKITFTRSAIDRHYKQKRTIEALGLRKLNSFVVKEDNPVIRGMVNKVTHLVTVEEIEG